MCVGGREGSRSTCQWSVCISRLCVCVCVCVCVFVGVEGVFTLVCVCLWELMVYSLWCVSCIYFLFILRVWRVERRG